VRAPIPREAFTARLDLLERSDQVTPSARQLTLDFVDAAEAQFGVELDEENAAMLVTHLAVALTRTELGAPATGPPPAGLASEIRMHERERAFVHERLDAAGRALGAPLPEAEEVFITAHLCTVVVPD
jgi:hypothetical protein